MKYDIRNLVVLKYADNPCFPSVVDALGSEIEGLSIHPEEGKWNFNGDERKIGESRNIESRWGAIGVYDRTNTHHLSSMAHDAKRAMQERLRPIVGY